VKFHVFQQFSLSDKKALAHFAANVGFVAVKDLEVIVQGALAAEEFVALVAHRRLLVVDLRNVLLHP